MTDQAARAAEVIKLRYPLGSVETAVILGRNCGAIAKLVESPISISYAELPGFPEQHVGDGEAILGNVDGAPTLLLRGRPDFHDAGDPACMSSAIETLALLGVRSILSVAFVTSANAQIAPSNLVAITDHIDFRGLNPLIGTSDDKRFVNLNEAYDKRLLRRLKTASTTAGVGLQEGVMIWFSGPSFETPAEVRAARLLGGDIMGVSIAPEAILARRYGVPFAGVAVVTDYGAGFSGGSPSADFSRGHVVAGLVAMRRLVRAYAKIR
jgi:purine-nucleoside phosphorylase